MIITLVAVVLSQSALMAQTVGVKELADYRLTADVFKQFEHASRLIAAARQNDPALADEPLLTREVSVTGDAVAMAGELEARLLKHPKFADALFAADISAREYTKFALALIAARLAHGFVKAGVLHRIPAGVATDNVAFVETHDAAIRAVLQKLGVVDRYSSCKRAASGLETFSPANSRRDNPVEIRRDNPPGRQCECSCLPASRHPRQCIPVASRN